MSSKRAIAIVNNALGEFKALSEKALEQIAEEVSVVELFVEDEDALHTIALCLGKAYMLGHNAGLDCAIEIYKARMQVA